MYASYTRQISELGIHIGNNNHIALVVIRY